MNNKILAFAVVLALVAVAGCRREPGANPAGETSPEVVAVADHGSPAGGNAAFDTKAFAGTYGGTLPCADCPGIDTSIAFDADGGYRLTEAYRERDSANSSSGAWTLNPDGRRVLLDPESKDEPDRWLEIVSPDELRMLDGEGNLIESRLNYNLQRK